MRESDKSATAERVLELARRSADQCEVIFDESLEHSAEFENNVLKGVSASQSRGVGLRVIHRGRIGLSSATDLDDLGRLVECALASAAFGQEAKFEFPSRCDMPQVRVHDRRIADFPMAQGVEMSRAAIAFLLERMPDVKCAGGVSWDQGSRRLLNSRGLDLQAATTTFDMGIEALRVDETGFLAIGEGEEWRELRTDMMRHARAIAEKFALAEKTVGGVSGRLPVLFTPKAAGLLLQSFAANTNGKYLQKGISILKGREGEKILDERITLWDDSLADFAPDSFPFDGEGVGCRRLPIFENGVMRNFIFDLQTAGMLGRTTTGSAMRSFRGQPSPGHANLRLTSGALSFAEILREMKRGIVVDQVLGGGQSNVLAGEFSVNLDLGYLVENGEIVGRLKDTMVAGNVFDAFNNILALGKDLEWHHGEELPAICFRELAVSGGGN